MNIPLYKVDVRKKEIESVTRVLLSGKLSRGTVVDRFEKEFARYANKKYAIAVNSGTSGLHVCVRALGWKKGDEVITTPFSYIASSNCLLFESVTPIFVDINPSTLNIDTAKIESKITKKTKGILLVDIFGLPNIKSEIKKIKNTYNISILEDACEAIGRPSDDFTVSTIGDLSVYGFYENKQMTSGGEGGMIVTNNKRLADICRSMRDQGRSTKKDWLNNVILGYNFRMTEMQAAFGSEQLKRIDTALKAREKIANMYHVYLKDTPAIITPQLLVDKKRSWFIYFILLENSAVRERVYLFLKAKGIETSKNYFTPIYHFPMYSFCKDTFKVTDNISKRILALPMFNTLSGKEIEKICTYIKQSLYAR